jgi:hypothetical protein
MVNEFKELVKHFKEDPKEAIGSLVVVILLFAFLYAALWFDAIISGRV